MKEFPTAKSILSIAVLYKFFFKNFYKQRYSMSVYVLSTVKKKNMPVQGRIKNLVNARFVCIKT